MKNRIKILLHKIGAYDTARNLLIKIYYPYKNYQIRKKANIILSKLRNVFEEETDKYWLDYGTLLGYVRERKIIKGDLDLDFGIMVEDDKKSLEKLLRSEDIFLIQRTIVEGRITMEQYQYKDIGFDIFYYRSMGDKIVTNVWLTDDYSVPQKISYENGGGILGETTFTAIDTEKVEFYEVPFYIPRNAELYLTEHFGEDYMIPNPNFSHKDEKNRIQVNKEFKVVFY